jgi:hypothetical protein
MQPIEGIEINGYSNHLVMIDKVFQFYANKKPINKVFEYGCGFGSTVYFCKKAKMVHALEMQSPEWYMNVLNILPTYPHLFLFLGLGKESFDKISLVMDYQKKRFASELKYDLVFVDGHGDSRPECINYVGKNKLSDIIIAHDTEEAGYRWHLVDLPQDYHCFTMKTFNNYTTIWAKDQELIQYLKDNLL